MPLWVLRGLKPDVVIARETAEDASRSALWVLRGLKLADKSPRGGLTGYQ